ncbi:MAG: aldehyde dehydrogenase family protein [Novosphingobium sp.]|uniref:aldehyde dehydrogenase family protein n=1 Tax=Novosphingobium sp. TaxID=1874826 RepID=UPI003B9BB340
MSERPIPFDGNQIAPETERFLGETHRLLIGGEWVEGSGQLETRDPATGLVLATFQTGGAAEIDRAVQAARTAFEGPWGRMTVAERTALLHRLARVMDANATLLTELDVIDNGMPRFIAGLTTANCVEMIDYYAGAVMRIEGTTIAPPRHIAAETEALTYTLREPVGVAGQIVPWNVPLSTAILKLAPALAAGCTVVMKPSEETPLSALALGRMILEAGIPAGVVNIVNGLGAQAGQALAEHPGVDKISFTGSTATGRKIVMAALGNLKKVSLELGGKSPVVVMPDADLALAVPGVAMATFFLQGQNCMAGTRIFAHAAIHDELMEGLAAFAAQMTLGHGLDFATMQGPMISDAHAAKVMGYIDRAKADGLTLVAGGEKLDRPGNFIQPTIFTGCDNAMPLMREEIFGPVMAVQKIETDDLDAIAALANDTPYGLSGSVWTRDLSTAHRMVKRIRSGHVSINCHGAVGTNIPFGGYGQSGWGREFGQEGLDAYLETKAVTARL